jgi:hypothetical protein
MPLLSADTPLYNHPLPQIEQWLTAIGGRQDSQQIHCWLINRPDWQAEIALDIQEIVVSYHRHGDRSQLVTRSFKYSLSRQDIEDAIIAGP